MQDAVLRSLFEPREGHYMVSDEWIIPEEVTIPGYYWFGDSGELSLVLVSNGKSTKANQSGMVVSWHGSDWHEDLDQISGRFMGPLLIPLHWINGYK